MLGPEFCGDLPRGRASVALFFSKSSAPSICGILFRGADDLTAAEAPVLLLDSTVLLDSDGDCLLEFGLLDRNLGVTTQVVRPGSQLMPLSCEARRSLAEVRRASSARFNAAAIAATDAEVLFGSVDGFGNFRTVPYVSSPTTSMTTECISGDAALSSSGRPDKVEVVTFLVLLLLRREP